MMLDKQVLRDLIARIPESEMPAATRYIEFLLNCEAPVDVKMRERIDLARAHPSSGIPHGEVLREFGL